VVRLRLLYHPWGVPEPLHLEVVLPLFPIFEKAKEIKKKKKKEKNQEIFPFLKSTNSIFA